jgi:hypothetical protein
MTEYTDVPRANELHAESQLITKAIANLEAGGTLSSMVIAPPPPVPYDPAVPPPTPATTIALMPISIMTAAPVDAVVLANITAWLNQRLVDIAAELQSLGVTVPPAGDAQWSTGPSYPGGMAQYMTPLTPPTPPTRSQP